MSVCSRALIVAVTLGLFSGCATSTSDMGGAALPTEGSNQLAIDGTTSERMGTAFDQSFDSSQAAEMHQLATVDADGLGIAVERGGQFTRFKVDAGTPDAVYEVITMDSPPRLVVDLLGQPRVRNASYPLIEDPYVAGLRLGAHEDKTRLVFDLTEAGANPAGVAQDIDTSDGQFVVTFRGEEAASGVVEPLAYEEPAVDEPPAVTSVASLPEVPGQSIILDAVRFNKSPQTAGEVVVTFSEPVAYELRRTTPTEYVLNIPGVSASERTRVPQIAPQGFPGIRSVRAAQMGDDVQLRMFVDSGVALTTVAAGPDVIIKSERDARAQLGEDVLAAPRAQMEEEGEAEPTAADIAAPVDAGPVGGGQDEFAGPRYTGRLISLDLQDTDIDNALRIIAEVSNLNIIASDDVTGKVTLRLIDVPWDQALDVILKTNGLDKVREGNVIRIAPVEKLRAEREALREAKRAAQDLEDLTVNYIRVSYARVTDLREQVETVLSERGSITVDERTNQLVIKDIQQGQRDVIELVRRLDLRTPQVLLETQIVEGSRSILRDLGFQWNFTASASPETGNATGCNFPNSVVVGGGSSATAGQALGGNLVDLPVASPAGAITAVLDSADGARSLTARLSALESEGIAQVISRPQVATVNNQTATIKSVETIRVRLPDSGTSVATGQGASASGGGSTAFEEIDVGIELEMTPQASPDFYVLLDLNAKSSTFGSTEVDGIPSTVEREATSTVLVKDGQTFALGGVYRIQDSDVVDGIPFLKDLPVLGHAFRRSSIDKRDEELIFFITPHIVEGSFDPSLM